MLANWLIDSCPSEPFDRTEAKTRTFARKLTRRGGSSAGFSAKIPPRSCRQSAALCGNFSILLHRREFAAWEGDGRELTANFEGMEFLRRRAHLSLVRLENNILVSMHRVSQSCTSLVLSVTNGNTFFRILPIFQRLQLNRKPSRVAKEKREKKKKKKQELEQLQLFLSGGKTSARFFSRDHLHSRRNATVQSPGCCSWNRGGAELPRDETRRDETRV